MKITSILKTDSTLLPLLIKTIDFILYLGTALIVLFLSFSQIHLPNTYIIALIIAALAQPTIFSLCKVYQPIRGKRLWTTLAPIYFAITILVLTLAAIAFITKTGEHFSRAWFLTWHACVIIELTIFRIALRQTLYTLRQKGLNQKKIAILGQSDFVHEIIKRIQISLWSGFKVVAILDKDITAAKKTIAGIKVQEIPKDLETYIHQENIEEIWIAETNWDRKKAEKIIEELRQSIVALRYFPNLLDMNLVNHSVSNILGLPVINLIATPMIGNNRLIKALEDRIIAFLILFLISPLMALIAILVKLSSKGPVFYRQTRHGWDGKPITIYKFRSMVMHEENNGIVTQAKTNDSRITKMGKILRKTSLDELPQFINVLQGKMSIVGPRPHAVEHNNYYKKLIPSYMQRHQVKPGITGWAQINGWRGETDTLDKMKKRVEYDLYYINHWSLLFDLKIIFLTIFKGFIHKNAH